MSTPRTRPDAFGAMLAAFRAIYEAEIARLADLYRPRILAGEFSGSTAPPRDEWRLHALERELEETHPWLATERGRVAVVAASRWLEAVGDAQTHPRTGEVLGSGWDGAMPGETAAECMTHDVLAVAAERGWVKRMRYLGDPEPYALRVA